MSTALFTVVRYLVAYAAGCLAHRGWSVAAADGSTLDAVTQLAISGLGLAVPAAIGVLTGSVRWMIGRLKRRHAPALVAAAAEVVAVPAAAPPAQGAP